VAIFPYQIGKPPATSWTWRQDCSVCAVAGMGLRYSEILPARGGDNSGSSLKKILSLMRLAGRAR